MNRAPEVGDIVQCPADRGEAPYTGRIEHVDTMRHENMHGVRFYWVLVRRTSEPRTAHSWPSHRLGYTVR